MKGIIFNAFEGFITSTFSMETYDKVLEESELSEEVFVGPETYEDSVFLKIVGTAVSLSGLELDVAVKAFGKYAFKALGSKMPEVVSPYKKPQDLLMALDDIIHVEVRKLYPGATPPVFKPELIDGRVHLHYKSKRKFCALVEGLLEGMAEYFDTEIEVEKCSCMKKGDDKCTYKIKC